jgi:hypothetical protein
MADFLELIERIEDTESSKIPSFNMRDDGVPVRGQGRGNPQYDRSLAEAVRFMSDIRTGRRPMHQFREAMTRSDFPNLFGDILDRQLLARYQETPATWSRYIARTTVPDFRDVKRFAIDGAEGQLDAVAEKSEYPEATLSESQDTLAVAKYGRRVAFSWEAMINDDLDAFANTPDRLARAARRSEERFATELYVDSSGPHASLYDGDNTVTSNPVLSIESLQTAMQLLSEQTDSDGEPIVVEAVHLVVPPALEVTAMNILNALQIEIANQGGTSNQTMIAVNWMSGRVQVTVNPYIPIVASGSNGNTSWFLFADPGTSRPAAMMGFLRGNEGPALFRRASNAEMVGGGAVMESYETDSIDYKVRHIFGGSRLANTGGKKATVASAGSA